MKPLPFGLCKYTNFGRNLLFNTNFKFSLYGVYTWTNDQLDFWHEFKKFPFMYNMESGVIDLNKLSDQPNDVASNLA